MSEVIKYKTSSPAGDLLSLLPSIRQLYRLTGKKAIIYQALNVVGQGLQGYNQAFLNSEGESIMMSEQTFTNIVPLLKAQYYIEDVTVFTGQEVDYDMDDIRLKTFTNQPLGSINRWSFYVFPEMSCNLSEQWVLFYKKDESKKDTVFINFTDRYRNNWISYWFLKPFEKTIRFIGLPKERDKFCNQWGLNIELEESNDFLELANKMAACKFYMGNASMGFQIAEGLKIPRLLETYQVMPNVIPMGANGYDAYHQKAMQFYFNKLINK